MAKGKAKRKRRLIRLVSSEKTGTFFVKNGSKNKKIKLRKYDPKLRKHVMFEEKKST